MKLTQRAIAQLGPSERKYSVWCDELTGFGVRINASGTKSFVAKYRVGSKQKMVTLGRADKIPCEAARKRALQLMGAAASGVDAHGEAKAATRAETIEQLARTFLDTHVQKHLKATTASDYRRAIEQHIVPKLGKLKVKAIDRATVTRFHQSMSDTPYQANRVIATLSAMLSQAEILGIRPEGQNPCRRVKRFKEQKRERFLSTAEMARLAEALDQEAREAPMAATAFRLLILTGCRLGEIQKLKWDEVDFEREEIRLSDSKTGQRTVYLSPQGIKLLQSTPRLDGTPYVIAGREPGGYLTDLQKPWRRVRARAGLEDVRIHDLRHTFAANAAASGLSLPMIGKLLGHTQAQTTARYAHLAADPVRKANADVAKSISDAMGLT